MIERMRELNRRRHRTQKVRKLKAKLAATKDERAKEAIVKKIQAMSPFWSPEKTS